MAPQAKPPIWKASHVYWSSSYDVFTQFWDCIDKLHQTSTCLVQTYVMSSKYKHSYEVFRIFACFLSVVPPGTHRFICSLRKTYGFWQKHNKSWKKVSVRSFLIGFAQCQLFGSPDDEAATRRHKSGITWPPVPSHPGTEYLVTGTPSLRCSTRALWMAVWSVTVEVWFEVCSRSGSDVGSCLPCIYIIHLPLYTYLSLSIYIYT